MALAALVTLKLPAYDDLRRLPTENCNFLTLVEEDRLVDWQLSSEHFCETAFSDEHLDVVSDVVDSELSASVQSLVELGARHVNILRVDFLVSVDHWFSSYVKKFS